MSPRLIALAATAAMLAAPSLASDGDNNTANIWGSICRFDDLGVDAANFAGPDFAHHAGPVAKCSPIPTGYHTLTSVGDGADTSVDLNVGYDRDTSRLCFTATGLPEAPVLRVGVGHTLSVQIANTLHDTNAPHEHNYNCPIDSFGGEGICLPKPVFAEAPGPDGSFYPMMANEAHTADGTTNLHVHGLFVPPTACSDEVLVSSIYPANWRGRTGALLPCQAAANALAYSYQLPADHPAGAYWYHTHRHGQSEHETQMGLAGAIVVEDAGDAWRYSIGVSDEVLLVTDTPITACIVGPTCDVKTHPGRTQRQSNQAAARAAAASHGAPLSPQQKITLDPRIDEIDQAGECAQGASNNLGGYELWTLLLNGAAVPESLNGFPPDDELLTKTMQPGQRQIFRMVNASANSFLAPKLVLSQNGVEMVLPLEVFARDGVGIADKDGKRRFGYFDVAAKRFIVPPAGRVEFVVHAPPAGATLYLQSDQVAPGCGGNLYPARRLLLINTAGAPVDPGPLDDSDLLQHTPSLLPYLSTVGDTASVHRTFVLSEYGRGFTYGVTDWKNQAPTGSDYDPSQTDFFITEVASDDGSLPAVAIKPFTMHNQTPQVVVHLHGQDSVTEDWLVENATMEIHAFHMHQIHFRDVTEDGDDPERHPILDTITVPAAHRVGDIPSGRPGSPGWVKLRMTFTKQDIGEFVYHCHILEHEDNGMMGKVRVVAD